MARYLTELADVLRRAGLTVVEIPGWKTRGRPGSFNPTRVLAHHTGGKSDGYAYAKWMAVDGRADLKPPLAQLGLDRKGTWFVMAAGRANHAGRCKAIRGLKPYAGRDYGDGNAQMVGVEAMNTGSEGWAPAQYNSYVRGTAALTNHYDWAPPLGHKETSLSGKPDPGRMDMDKFRRDVKATKSPAGSGGGGASGGVNVPNPTPIPQEDSMSAQDVAELKDYLKKVLVTGYTLDGEWFPGVAAVDIENQRRITRTENALTALAAGLGPEVERAVRAALKNPTGKEPTA